MSVTEQHYFTLSLEQFIEFEKTFDLLFVGHNISFDIAVLRQRGAKVENYLDTQLMAAIWNGGSAENFSLETLGEMLGYPKMDLRQRLIDNGKLDPKAFKGAEYFDPSEEMEEYLYYDLRTTLAVFFHYLELYATDEQAWLYLINIEIPNVEVILEMQTGTIIDLSRLDEVQASLEDDLRGSWQALQDVLVLSGVFLHFDDQTWVPDLTKKGTVDKGEAGQTYRGVTTYSHCNYTTYSPSNGQHNIYILEKAYGWQATSFTDKGNKQLNKAELEKLSASNEFARILLEYRALTKLVETFVAGIRDATDPVTSVINPSYCAVCTRTHRLSSKSPNLQNLPARSKTASVIRTLFTTPDDYVLAVADLDRIEAVLLGWWLLQISEPDDRLAKVFIDRIDLHQTNADSWGISRFLAKTVLYLIMYGGSPVRLAIAAGIELDEAKRVFDSVDDGMPAIKLLKEWLVAEAIKQDGVLHDPLGNRYTIPELLSSDFKTRSKGQRLAFSYINQGFAGSLFKELQLRLREAFKAAGIRAKQILQVHDEVVFIVHKDDAERFIELGTDILSTFDILTTEGFPAIPVSGEFKTGKTWLDAK